MEVRCLTNVLLRLLGSGVAGLPPQTHAIFRAANFHQSVARKVAYQLAEQGPEEEDWHRTNSEIGLDEERKRKGGAETGLTASSSTATQQQWRPAVRRALDDFYLPIGIHDSINNPNINSRECEYQIESPPEDGLTETEERDRHWQTVVNRELKRQFNAHMNRQWQQKTHERLMRKAFSHISESDMHTLLNLASAHFDRRHKRAFNIEFYLIVVKFARMQLDLRANPAGVDPIDLLPKLFNLVATVPPRLRKENSEVREATDEVLRSAAPLVDRSNNSELRINYRASLG